MKRSWVPAGLAVLLVAGVVFVAPVRGQSHSAQALENVVRSVDFDRTPARDALEWLSRSAGFNLVISWRAMEAEGIDPDQPITLRLRSARAETVLRLIANELAGPQGMIMHIDRHYVRLMTREQANAKSVIRVYPVGDLLFEIPSFDDAPELSLDDALANDDGGGGDGIFDDVDGGDEDAGLTRDERAAALMDVIRNNIEPDLWEANGGLAARMTFYNGNLIVRAPLYVHKQIGFAPAAPQRSLPWLPGGGEAADRAPARSAVYDRPAQRYAPRAYGAYRGEYRRPMSSRSNGVSGINAGAGYLD